MNKIISLIQNKYYLFASTLIILCSKITFAATNDNPFPKIDVTDGNVVKTVGTQMETSMKYALIGGGIIMLLTGIGVIMHRLREDTMNKDTGSFLTTLLVAGLAITVGIILIAIGWTAASYTLTA